MALNVVQIPTSKLYLGLCDGAEFFDWSRKSFGKLWFSSNINKSPIILLAIQKTMSQSPMDMNQFLLDKLEENPQFVGFVTARGEENVVIHFHIHSYVLFQAG
jgi:hypothetical protein